jgi:RHS repeat-associated protein
MRRDYPRGVIPTDRLYTGQRQETFGLYDYRARYYHPALGRFISADPLVPEPGNPQALNRYAYVYNNPLRYTDPSGYAACIDDLCDLVAHPATGRPILRRPAPRIITYIHKEMVHNARSSTAQMIAVANKLAQNIPGGNLSEKSFALLLWTSQVMDARIKNYVGPLAPLFGNWDHKPILKGEKSPIPEVNEERPGKPQDYSTVGSRLYRFDIWSNIHYGYVGRASGFSQPELTGGAGIEQIGSELYTGRLPHRFPGADNWAASWDDPSDNEAIQIGIHLWDLYGLTVRPADIYLAVLEAPRLATLPLGGVP